jgi:hypothetical protein
MPRCAPWDASASRTWWNAIASTLLASYAMFGISLLGSLIIIALVWSRLLYHGLPPAGLVPTLWIVLGALGQSVTAAALLANAARPAGSRRAERSRPRLRGPGIWLCHELDGDCGYDHDPHRPPRPSFLADVVELHIPRRRRRHRNLAARPADARRRAVIAVGLYAMLTIGWAAAATGTARSILSGELLRPRAAGLQNA